MRVASTSRAIQVNKTRSPRGRGGTAGAFELQRTAAERRASATRGAAPLATTDAVLAAQMFDDSEQRKDKAVKQGNRMLDLLDELKVGLLGGRVGAQKLRDLEHALRNGQDQKLDPDLEDLMKQIDLRARVELAKLANIGE